jgi:hypothetical protein
MTQRKQTTPAGAVELEESQLDKAQGGATATNVDNVVQKVVGGGTNKIADGSVRPIGIRQG